MVVAYVQYTLFSRMPALASADGSTQSSDNTHSEFLCIMQLQSQLSQLDFSAFYLDDGYIAGGRDAVVTMLQELERNFVGIGLSLNRNKTVISPPPACDNAEPVQGWTSNPEANLSVLGAAVGADRERGHRHDVPHPGVLLPRRRF